MKIIHLWDLLRLILRDSHIRQSAKEALYYFTRLEETDSDNFSQGIFAWAKRLTEVQPYVYRELQSSQLPNNLSLIDDYGKVRALIEAEMAALPYQPLFTFIVPFYGGSSELLESTLGSIREQLYPHWEIYLLIDNKHQVEMERLSSQFFTLPQTVVVKEFVDFDANLAAASNEVLGKCKGDFVSCISAADTIARDAALEVARRINQFPDVDIIYSDEGSKAGEHFIRSFRKPGWAPDLICSLNYTQNLLCCRKSSVLQAGGFRGRFETDIKYDLVLKLTENGERVQHIPRVLYNEEALKTRPHGFNAGESEKMQRQALEMRLKRVGVPGKVSPGLIKGSFRVRRPIRAGTKISIIIPTRDKINLLKNCVDSIEKKSTFDNYEIIIIDNGSSEPASAEYFAHTRHKVIAHNEKFNYSRLNNLGAQHAGGEHLLFLNNDTEVIDPEWLEALLEHSQRAEVGAVGAKLLYPNGMIQHAGIVLGGRFVVDHSNRFSEIYDHGYRGLADVIRNFNSVTGACLMMRANVFQEIGGFDERLAVTYNDIDLCLKARALHYLVVYTPYAVLYHFEGVSVLGDDQAEIVTVESISNTKSSVRYLRVPKEQAQEMQLFYSKWESFIENDPSYTNEFRCKA